ncbi:hypothetical protein FG386_001744 [Cryptosporidium ryanae]|uniref:uncharacterized protein n=1 Tax=Cryptosporidium ryanae TaxID=515981 RepID=UPI00351A7E73|nr:hypothetical protein FG386_001744 [Cryptosporidium ryanae]
MLESVINSKISKLDSLISRYETLSRTKKLSDSTVSFCLQNIQNAVSSIQIELGGITEPTQRRKFDDFIKIRNERIQNIKNNWNNENGVREDDKLDIQNRKNVSSYRDDILSLNQSDLSSVEKGDTLIKLASDSVNRMKRTMAETEQIGDDSLTKMNSQSEQLDRIRSELQGVNENLSNARMIIKAITRNAATDFCVQVLCGILTISILIIIIISIIIGVKNNH